MLKSFRDATCDRGPRCIHAGDRSRSRLAAGRASTHARPAVAGPATGAGSARAAADRTLAAAARREPGPDQRNRKAVREIQIAAAAAEEPERGHRRFQRAHQGRRPEPVEHGKALDHGERAGGVSRVRQRRAGLQGRRRPAVPEQGLQGRQEPRHRCGREMLAESVPARLQAPAGRLQDRKLRDEGSVPVAHLQRRRRSCSNASPPASKRNT